MPANEPVFFHQGQKIAIFTWHGARLSIFGRCEYYKSEVSKSNKQLDIPNVEYVNVHAALNQERIQALKQKRLGPNLLVTGQHQSGKSTLCRILINYALKLGWTPLLVDLDLTTNEIAPPGSFGACQVEHPIPNDYLVQNSICYFQGSLSPLTQEFYDRQIHELSQFVHQKLQNSLHDFLREHQLDPHNEEGNKAIPGYDQLCPPFPTLYASGTIINGFTT